MKWLWNLFGKRQEPEMPDLVTKLMRWEGVVIDDNGCPYITVELADGSWRRVRCPVGMWAPCRKGMKVFGWIGEDDYVLTGRKPE